VERINTCSDVSALVGELQVSRSQVYRDMSRGMLACKLSILERFDLRV